MTEIVELGRSLWSVNRKLQITDLQFTIYRPVGSTQWSWVFVQQVKKKGPSGTESKVPKWQI